MNAKVFINNYHNKYMNKYPPPIFTYFELNKCNYYSRISKHKIEGQDMKNLPSCSVKILKNITKNIILSQYKWPHF